MKKLLALISVLTKETLEYRSSFLIWVAIDLIGPISLVAVWLAAYQNHSIIGGLSEQQMVTYYLGVIFVTLIVTVHEEWDIREDIRYGKLRFYLTRPFSFALKHTVAALVWRAYTSIISVPIALVLFSWIAANYSFQLPPLLTVQFVLAMIITLAVWLSLSHLLGYITFFIERPNGIYKIVFVVRWLVSGSILPLTLFPTWAQQFLSRTPFPYFASFPIEVLTESITPDTFLPRCLIGLGWAALFTFIAVVLWKKGIAAYDAPEGQEQS